MLPHTSTHTETYFLNSPTRMHSFAGDCEIGQIFTIFQFFGTPTEKEWPGVTSYPDFKNKKFPQFKPKPLDGVFPSLDAQGKDLLLKMIRLDPAERIQVKQALNHPFFEGMDQSQSFQ